MIRTLGTLLRHLVFLLDHDLESAYRQHPQLRLYRPRYTPVIVCLLEGGALSIRELADEIGLSHSALSQTVSQMDRDGWVTIRPDTDGRTKLVHLSPKLRKVLPLLEQQWAATSLAAKGLESDIGAPLADVVSSAIRALEGKSFQARIRAAADDLQEDA